MPALSTPALIFDLDGTLIDTAPDLLAATNAVLAEAGRATVDPASLRQMVGFGARALILQAMEATGGAPDEAELPRLVDSFVAHYRAHIADHSVVFPRVEATLAALKDSGARLAVLTNKPHELTGLLLPALKMEHYFDAIFGAGRMSYTKPDPRIFHDVVAEIGGPGSGAIMIGDSKTDVATARAAGVPVIVVSYGYTTEPAHTLGGDALINDFAQIPALVAQMLATT